MRAALRSRTQGQRTHYLANLGGLICLAELGDLDPRLLLGALLSAAAQLRQPNPERDDRLTTRGAALLEQRDAEKRAFKAHSYRDVQAVYLRTPQLAALVRALKLGDPSGGPQELRALVESFHAE
jgi:hypothetical protein